MEEFNRLSKEMLDDLQEKGFDRKYTEKAVQIINALTINILQLKTLGRKISESDMPKLKAMILIDAIARTYIEHLAGYLAATEEQYYKIKNMLLELLSNKPEERNIAYG